MKKTDGGLKHSQVRENGTGDLLMGQENPELPNMSEMTKESEDYALLAFLEENPEASLSNLINSLQLLENTGWWFAITPIKAQDGTILARISIAPPEKYEIEILEDSSTGIKKIVLNKK
jgi:hypothetical protein